MAISYELGSSSIPDLGRFLFCYLPLSIKQSFTRYGVGGCVALTLLLNLKISSFCPEYHSPCCAQTHVEIK